MPPHGRMLLLSSLLLFAGRLYRQKKDIIVRLPYALKALATQLICVTLIAPSILILGEDAGFFPSLSGQWREVLGMPHAALLLGLAVTGFLFARAVKLLPDDPDLLVEAAQSRLYASSVRKLDTQAIAWVRHALSVQP